MSENEPAPLDSVAIHASAVRANGGALLFLGPARTGKTTMCRLLSSRAEVLAEDAVYLVLRAGGWEVVGGDSVAHREPLSREQAAAARGAPLQVIVRLYQAQTPRLEPLDGVHTCRHLADAFFEIIRQRQVGIEAKRVAFTRLAAISRAVPGYRFHFDLSSRALETLNDEFDL